MQFAYMNHRHCFITELDYVSSVLLEGWVESAVYYLKVGLNSLALAIIIWGHMGVELYIQRQNATNKDMSLILNNNLWSHCGQEVS